ncbi:MAG: P-type conjugative transfer protein TrbG [Ruminobacter sp.]|uniref:P-type conjugative transfer protein TrbG n=1 Tax=Ruminobacter sp. TaxID=2774296 RepID=UPI001B4D38B5|nr:P-type conjugative transfer protein TrbG [Ruminobacter sp.]MBP3748817.1 P-type conjugative transfer protein TrbG [Ruminobacter sp.]
MKFTKNLLTFALLSSLSAPALADAEFDAYTFDIEEPILSDADYKAIEMSSKINDRTMPLTEGSNGYIQYVYGVQTPRVVCSPMRICDVKLQAGETIFSLHAGDTTRWTIEPALEGDGASEVEHIIIKPLDVGISTNMVITTNRRVYHIDLSSSKSQNIPRISFVYPEESLAKFKLLQDRKKQTIANNTIPETNEYLGNLDFEYEVTGADVIWKPVRVYNDGKKTVIEMPSSMNSNESPALLVTRYNKNSRNSEQLVNYRVQNNRYIVDAIFYEAELVLGVGSDQDKVTVRRSK